MCFIFKIHTQKYKFTHWLPLAYALLEDTKLHQQIPTNVNENITDPSCNIVNDFAGLFLYLEASYTETTPVNKFCGGSVFV